MTNKKYYKNYNVKIYWDLNQRDYKELLARFNEAYKDKINKILQFKDWEDVEITIEKDEPFFKGPNLNKSNGRLHVSITAENGDLHSEQCEYVEDCFKAIWNHDRFI